ncbi:hypothetical protein [Orenia marismortui]|uniref:hypothetical protein n=1 Tax=Orenia marismortui TaxID=46469 RepID=UPI0003677552|nr:hypothetical protein [Orenia marismortui]
MDQIESCCGTKAKCDDFIRLLKRLELGGLVEIITTSGGQCEIGDSSSCCCRTVGFICDVIDDCYVKLIPVNGNCEEVMFIRISCICAISKVKKKKKTTTTTSTTTSTNNQYNNQYNN